MNSRLLKQITSATQPEILFDVTLLSGLFSKTANGEDKNSSFSVKKRLLSTLLSSIMPKKLSNLLLRPCSNYSKLKKGKPKMALIS